MEKNILGITFTVDNIDQILNMGGPWICSLSLGNRLIAEKCIVDNFLANELSQQIFFVEYHRVSKWKKDNYFTIDFFDISSNEIYEFEKRFDMVYLKSFSSSNEIEIFYAFHDKNFDSRDIFNIGIEHYRKIK